MGINESRFSIMATYRGQGSDSYSIGAAPPAVMWTLVRGDTAAFRVYVTDEDRVPLNISEWNISMDIVRPPSTLIVSLTPEATVDDEDGEFTVSLSAGDSEDLETGDIFDIQLSDASRVWTVCKGTITVVEDVTGPYES
jgi:hypothetical protein